MDKTKVVVVIVALAVSFATGRYSVPKNTQDEIKESTTQTKDLEKDKHKKIVTVEVDSKDGGKQITTTTTEDTATKVDTTKDKITDKTESTETGGSTLNISVLGALHPSFFGGDNNLVYGGAITKQLIGPLTLGVFGLSSGVVGVSFGLNL